MSVRAEVAYLGRFVRRKLGLGSYLAEPVVSSGNPTMIRVLNPELFDPIGGTLWWVSGTTDKFFTYTGVNGDLLTGIPASGSGEIDADMNAFNHATAPTLIYKKGVDDEELERAIDRYLVRVVEELFMDSSEDGFRWSPLLGWWGTGAEVRDDYDDTYNVVTLGGSDTINYETGQIVFATARAESRLWLAGDTFNPFAVIADLIESGMRDDRFSTYSQVGQAAKAQPDARDLAKYWRGRGAALNFCRGV